MRGDLPPFKAAGAATIRPRSYGNAAGRRNRYAAGRDL